MVDLNRATIIGNMTATPELKQTPSGQNVVSFSVATNRMYKDQSGQLIKQAEFHNIVAWGKLAEIIAQYCVKGKRVYVEGRLQTRSWEDQSGAKHYKTEIVAENLIMLDRAQQSSDNAGDPMMASVTEVTDSFEDSVPQSEKKTKKTKKDEDDISIEDVPF